MQVLKNLVDRLKLLSDLDVAMVDKLFEMDKRLSDLETDHKKTRRLSEGNSSRLGEIQLLLGARRDAE